MALHPGLPHRFLDAVHHQRQPLRPQLRHQQQEFVAAVAHQNIALPQAGLHRRRDAFQRLVAHQMAVAVVHGLEAVHVNDHHTVDLLTVGQKLFKVPAGVGPGERIDEGTVVKVLAAVQQHAAAAHVQPASVGQLGNHFQHAAAAVVLHIARQHKIGVLAIEFDLVQGLFAGEHLGRDAVLAPAGLVPHHMAVTGLLFQRAVRVQGEHLGALRVHQTHQVKHALQLLQDSRHRASGAVQQHIRLRLCILGLLRQQLARHAHTAALPAAAPLCEQHQPVRLVSAAGLHLHGEAGLRDLRGCLFQRFQQAAAVLQGEEVQPFAMVKVQHLGALGGAGVVVGHRHPAAEQVTVELDTAALVRIELGALAFQVEQPLAAVLPREGFPVQDLLRQAVGVLVEAAVPLVALQLLPQQLRRLIQAFQQQRVEGPALAVQDHAQGRVVVVGRFIAAVAGQGVVHICQCHHLCCDGDRIALQLVRVAAAVPALMVPAADGIGHLQQGLVSPADGVAQVPQDAGTLHRVGLDHRVFFGGQAAGLVEDLGGDHDFAQVVQGRCRADERNVALVQLVVVGLARQLVQQ